MKYYILIYNRAPIGESGESCKSNYSIEIACRSCGTGGILVGKLKTKGLRQIKKDFFITLDDDFIISENLYQKLITDGIKLGDLRKIVDYKNNDLPFYHLNTNIILPPSKMNNFAIEGQCPVCKRNGYFSKVVFNQSSNVPTKVLPFSLQYSKEQLDSLFFDKSDIFFTWECTGLSNLTAHDIFVVRYARPLLVISEKFKESLDKYEIKGLKFEEIFISNDI